MIDDYAQKDRDAVNLRTEIILYAKSLRKELDRLQTEISAGQEKFEQIEKRAENRSFMNSSPTRSISVRTRKQRSFHRERSRRSRSQDSRL